VPLAGEQLLARHEPLPELSAENLGDDQAACEALIRENLEVAQNIAQLFDQDNGAQIYQQLVGSLPDPITQMYRIASLANLDLEQQQAVLACDTTLALGSRCTESCCTSRR
jgi:preprotein translocase subunit Sec63